MGDEMEKDLKTATENENSAIAAHEALMKAKKKEIEALSASIEKKLTRQGELGVKIVQMKNELTDTQEALIADKKFLKELEEGCSKKDAEWAERQKTRAEELVALADTIKLLNDDDALELFKKTLPSASAVFLQVQVSSTSARARALTMIQEGMQKVKSPNRVGLDLISLALHGKKIGFEKVISMIDEMVATLKKEQVDDDNKKTYCAEQLDTSDDQKKSLERKASDTEAAIALSQDTISTLTEEIAALTLGIQQLDKAVAEATANRRAEHAEYSELIASNSAAKEILGMAKNRLQQFYNPKLAKPDPTTPAMVQSSQGANPGMPPATWGAFNKQSQSNGGVVAMITMLIGDLDKQMTEAEAEE